MGQINHFEYLFESASLCAVLLVGAMYGWTTYREYMYDDPKSLLHGSALLFDSRRLLFAVDHLGTIRLTNRMG